MTNASQIKPTTSGMSFGAVAMFDALGFKGIWEDVRNKGQWKAEDVIQKMSNVQNVAAEVRRTLIEQWPVERKLGSLNIRVVFLSDTVIIFTSVQDGEWAPFIDVPDLDSEQNEQLRTLNDAQWYLANFACLKLCVIVAARIIGAAALERPEFNYRGAITIGDFLVSHDSSFFVGPAVDRCAEAYERAQGAFVLMTAEANEFRGKALESKDLIESFTRKSEVAFETDLNEIVSLPQLIEYSVPVKLNNGSVEYFETYVVNPLATWTRNSWQDRVNALLNLFEGDDTVLLKKENTEKFFDAVMKNVPE